MKKTKYLLVICLLISCTKNETIELTILNDSLNCIDNLDSQKIYNGDKKYDRLYDSLSTTIVKYKLHNPTNKKYFIVFESSYFNNYDEVYEESDDSNKKMSLNNINLSLYSDYKVKGDYSSAHNGNPNLNTTNYYNYIMYGDSLTVYRQAKISKLKDTYALERISEFEANGFVIYPNETKYFTSIINLPLRNYKLAIFPWNTNVKKGKEYKAGLTLYNDGKEIERYLSSDLKKEIEDNGYIIFDGVIKSNKVPVKLISIP